MNQIAIEDLMETITAMKKQEKSSYRTENGLYNNRSNKKTQQIMNSENRRLMVAWCKKLANFCNFHHHTLAIAINILDRFVAKEPQIITSGSSSFQLATMAALYTSVKIHEDVVLDTTTMSKLSKGVFSSQEIEKMESRILMTLDWRVNTPTAMSFAEMYLQILVSPRKQQQIKIAKKLIQCQLEYAMEDCQFLGMDASEIAFTATYNAVMVTFGHSSRLEDMQQAIELNFLPFQFETILMDHMHRTEFSAISSFRASATQPTKKQQSSIRSLPRHNNLSPRSTAIA